MFLPFSIAGFDAMEIPSLPCGGGAMDSTPRNVAYGYALAAWMEQHGEEQVMPEPLPLAFGLCVGSLVCGVLLYARQEVNGFNVNAERFIYLPDIDPTELEAATEVLQLQTEDEETYTVTHVQ